MGTAEAVLRAWLSWGASRLHPPLTGRFPERRACPEEQVPVAHRTRTLGPSQALDGGTQGLHGFAGQKLPCDSDLAA